jgi:hypothetical protein
MNPPTTELEGGLSLRKMKILFKLSHPSEGRRKSQSPG